MSIFKIVGIIGKVVASVECDDNGHPYRDDNGGWLPNNEYDLDGVHYETDVFNRERRQRSDTGHLSIFLAPGSF